jgi:hypothetical protein
VLTVYTSGLMFAQGSAIALAGAAGELLPPGTVLTGAGGLGVVLGLVLAARLPRDARRDAPPGAAGP